MNPARRLAWIAPWLALCLLVACSAPVPPSDPRDLIELRWIKAYPRESRSDVETGLLWGLSHLGARLPRGAQVVRWHGDTLTLDLAQAQVLEETLPAWRSLLAAMKASGEYQALGALDIGRFMALTLGSSRHYYALTGADPRYHSAISRLRFVTPAAIAKSAVAHGNRLIEVSEAQRVDQLAFIAREGEGIIGEGSFVPQEIELLDVMPNGQLRFALYGLDGNLKSAASVALTRAGKPAKCMWCHESGLHTTLVDFAGVPGHLDRAAFDSLVRERQKILSDYRDALDIQIDYRELQDHTYAELLYLTFEEPSLDRLAREWGVSTGRAAQLLVGKPVHAQEEFAYLGEALYLRADVESLAPYAVQAVPQSVREPSAHEPDLIERPGH